MRTVTITTKVNNPEIVNIIKEAKEKKVKIQELLASGVPASEIPEDLKIRLSK